jgi:hypothetical protein
MIALVGLAATTAYAVATNVSLVAGGSPVANAKVKITLNDGSTTEGTTDANGRTVLDVTPQSIRETEVTTEDGQKRRRGGAWPLTGDTMVFDWAAMSPVAGVAAATSAPSTTEPWSLADYFKSGELYGAGLIGMNVPTSLSSVQSTQLPGLQFSDLKLQNNPIYEGKLGYYFPPIGEKVRLGGEVSYSFTNPNIKQQPVTATFGGSSFTDTTPGFHTRLSTLAYHFLLRWDGLGDLSPALKNFSPYGGIGPAIGWFRVANDAGSAANTTLGYSAVYGVRWKTSLEHVAIWLEGSHRSFSPTLGKDVLLKGDYSDNAVKIGVSVYWTGDKSAW